jgi:peptidyl-prolyl cis-trans isomerase D
VPKVATVNGDDVTQQEMQIAVERGRRMMINQNVSPANIDEDLLRIQVLENLINRKLLTQAVDELGLHFGDERDDDEIIGSQAFQVDGQFSAQQFQMVIGSAGFTPMTYRDEVKLDKRIQQLSAGLLGSAFLTGSEVVRASSLSQQTRDVAFLRIEVEGLLPVVSVELEEIDSYYQDNRSEFMTTETVDLEYLEIRRNDFLDQVEANDDVLKLFFEETRDLYAVEERRRVAHILIEINDDVTEADARAKIDDIYQQIVDGGEFAALAEEHSQDPGSAGTGGDLGFNGRGTYVEAFETAVYELAIDEITLPVLTEFGYHIIKLMEIEPPVEPAFAEVRDQVDREYRRLEAEKLFVDLSSRLSEMAFESPDLIDPSETLNIELKSTGHIDRNQADGIGSYASVVAAAFSTDLLLDGNNSQLLELNPNHHVVVRVREHRPQEFKPLASVTDEIRVLLAQDKANALAIDRASELVDMLEEGSVTRYVADQYDLEWQVTAAASRNQAGLDREINQEAFQLPRPAEGSKSVGYAVLADGDTAVISVTNVVNKSQSELPVGELATLSRVLGAQKGSHQLNEFRQQLEDNADVERL